METRLMDYLASFKYLMKEVHQSIQKLLKLEEQKYEALIQVDVKALMKVNTVEEEILQFMDTLEGRRQETIASLARELGFDSDISLSEMITYFPLEMQDEFMRLRDEVKAATARMEITMRENTDLVKTNLDIVNFTLNFANRSAQQETYDFRNKKESKEKIYLVNQIA